MEEERERLIARRPGDEFPCAGLSFIDRPARGDDGLVALGGAAPHAVAQTQGRDVGVTDIADQPRVAPTKPDARAGRFARHAREARVPQRGLGVDRGLGEAQFVLLVDRDVLVDLGGADRHLRGEEFVVDHEREDVAGVVLLVTLGVVHCCVGGVYEAGARVAFLFVLREHEERLHDAADLRGVLELPGGLARLAQRWEQDAHQDADDRDDHKQFNERECLSLDEVFWLSVSRSPMLQVLCCSVCFKFVSDF